MGSRNVVRAVYLATERDRPFGADEFSEEEPSVHFIFRVAQDELALQLELDDRDGLEELGGNVAVFRHAVGHVRREEVRAGIVAVLLHGEERERTDVQAVAVLEHIKVAVLGANFAGRSQCTRGCPWAAPIQRMSWLPQTKSTPCMSMRSSMTICAAGAAVKNVADDVQLVYRQTGDEIRERHDEPGRQCRSRSRC